MKRWPALGLLLISTAQSELNDEQIALDLINDGDTCSASRHVLFHKKHKSASSTLAAILKDFSRKQKLIMAKTPVPAFLGGYPAPFDPSLVRGLPTNGQKFDIILHHLRFHKQNLQRVLHDDTVYLTSMRNPLSQFVSTFNFFYGRFQDHGNMKYKSNKGGSLTCWGHPFVEFLGGPGRTPNEFINKASEIYNSSAPWHFRAKNFQAYELGLENEIEDEESMKRIWQTVNQQFDLIMITEYYWESLILMKDLLCMNWYDLYIDSRTVGSYEKPTFTTAEVEKFAEFNKLDQFLYKKSNETFWQKAAERPGGIEQLQTDKLKLQALYRYCEENKDLCQQLKSDQSFSKFDKDVDQSMGEVETFSDNFEKLNHLFDQMEQYNGDCPYGFYQKFKNLPEEHQREITDQM